MRVIASSICFVPIFDSIDKGDNADGLSKDLSKAFDSVDQSLLLSTVFRA